MAKATRVSGVGMVLAGAIALSGLSGWGWTGAAAAQNLFEEQGTLQPMQAEYTFTGKAGDTVMISLSSSEFDTLLVVLSPTGEELATNDDYARSLNSAVVLRLPANGTYKVLTRSFSGQGGNYLVTVRNATPYDVAYARAGELYRGGQLEEALAAYNEAIRLDPEQPIAYLDRADIYYTQSNLAGVRADYERAIALYTAQGDDTMAQNVREQLSYLEEADSEIVP